MRLSEDRIKEAILHTDLEIRQRAIQYFAKSFSTDTAVMPLVIKAVEMFGKEEAYHLIGPSRDLPQTEETINWIIDELNDSKSDQYENYTFNLSLILVRADAALVLPKESAILDSLHLFPGVHASISERLKMLSWDEATCWQELGAFCEEGKDKQYINDVNLNYANHIVEALARCGDHCEEKIHSILEQEIADYHNNPMKWLEPLMVRLAGEIQLDSMVPVLIAKLVEDGGDLTNEECARALCKIGKPAVITAISDMFIKAPHHFRLYAIEPLEHIHSDLTVETCLSLLEQEKDLDIRVNLGYALLSHFSAKCIDEVRQLLIGRTLDSESRGLRDCLVEVCTIMGEEFPEMEEWRSAKKTEIEQHRRWIEEFGDDPVGLMQHTLAKMQEEKQISARPRLDLPNSAPTPQKIGRNAPCTCGSGKKYKKCCMNKSSGNTLLN